jgi:hypothetical protein
MAGQPCESHVTGFGHLSLRGLDRDIDLGFKFEQRESELFRLDPNTGVRAYAEPLLILHVSVRQQGSVSLPSMLRYGLSRSKFSGGLTANEADRKRLLETSAPQIRADIADMKAGARPEAIQAIRMI